MVWNRYYTYDGITDFCKKLADAHPNLVKVESIGKSYEGRDIWALTITDNSVGNADKKPGFYIDGNIHSNEIQGAEFAMYIAWYLAESHNEVDYITSILQDKVFYIVPTINPDARENFMTAPNTMHSPRSGMIPIDNDRDNLYDEDGMDDLDGNGSITQMRRKSKRGRWKQDPDDPRLMVRVGVDEQGDYELLGSEGFDNDGDGRVNEDGTGYYDPNRDWGWNWQPNYVQRGAYKYPFSVPENACVKDFVLQHMNIAGAQSFHNTGGMLLRGPGAEEDKGTYNATDIQVYDAIGEKGEKLIPGYDYLTVYKDLYSVFGGELDWFFGSLGVITFTNELYTSYMMFNEREASNADRYAFDKDLLFEDAFVEWKAFDHPQYGAIEIGGFKKNYTRANPGFLIESDAHRNMAFCLYHAYHTPKLVIDEVKERSLGGGLKEITVTVANERMIPTHTNHDVKNNIARPDYISIKGVQPIAGMVVQDEDLNISVEQKNRPERIAVDNIPGNGTVKVRWIVKGNGNYTIDVDSLRGGVVSQ